MWHGIRQRSCRRTARHSPYRLEQIPSKCAGGAIAMEYALDRFEREVREALERQARIPLEYLEVVTPKPGVPADLAFPTFRIAREHNIAPPRFADDLLAVLKFDSASLIGRL